MAVIFLTFTYASDLGAIDDEALNLESLCPLQSSADEVGSLERAYRFQPIRQSFPVIYPRMVRGDQKLLSMKDWRVSRLREVTNNERSASRIYPDGSEK